MTSRRSLLSVRGKIVSNSREDLSRPYTSRYSTCLANEPHKRVQVHYPRAHFTPSHLLHFLTKLFNQRTIIMKTSILATLLFSLLVSAAPFADLEERSIYPEATPKPLARRIEAIEERSIYPEATPKPLAKRIEAIKARSIYPETEKKRSIYPEAKPTA